MKIRGFTFGTGLSLVGHIALLQCAVLFGFRGESALLKSEVIEVEFAAFGSEVGFPGGQAVVAPPAVVEEEVAKAALPVPPVTEAKRSPAKKRERPAKVVPPVSKAEPEIEELDRGVVEGASGGSATNVPVTGSVHMQGGYENANGGTHAVRAGYGSELASWLNRFKVYPPLARRRGVEGDAKVRLIIRRNGALLSSSLFVRSGSTLLDDGAMAMVQAASPFPPVPQELGGERFEFEVPVSFRLR